ncbi:hypothetical protein BZG02_06850 [Labilibaculum filiforme]|uniref:PKD domain-containing protein n=1 Tax=Labilibaculum filiforme TaxID=1940526 RepID=A0A2N3I0B6_9BACT|nr:hypothetical protein BZG02_06850 [Labilibaculum filiforme]
MLFLLLFASVGMGTFSRLSAGGKLNKDQFFNLAPLPIPAPPVPTNDYSCAAISLIVSSSCSFSQFTNVGATIWSPGDPEYVNDDGLSDFDGGDVWFIVTVPTSGELFIKTVSDDENDAWMDKVRFAIYKGACSSPTILEDAQLDNDESLEITGISGVNAGDDLLIRVWDHHNVTGGIFELCVYDECVGIVVDAGLNDTICKSALSYSISGTSSANTSSVTWTTSGDGGFDDSSQENPIYTLGSNDKNNGSVTLTKTGYNSLGCSDVIDEMILTISPDPIAEAGDDDAICETELSYTFSGPTSSNGDIQWSTTGAGTFNDATLENPTYTFDLSDSETLTFTKTVSVNGCSNANNMDLTISESTIAIAGSGGESCDVDFTFDATTPSVGIGTWSIVSKPITGGIFSYSTNNNDPKTTVTVTAPGNYEFAWTVVNGACTDADTIGVVFIQNIFSVPGPNSNVCDTKIGRLTVISNSVGTPHWNLKSGPGTADIKTPNSFESDVEVSVFGLYEFTLTVTSGSCSVSNDMQIEFHQSPIIEGVVAASICKDSPSYEITGSSSINATDILWSTSGNGTFDDATVENPIYTIGSSDISTVTLTKTVSNIGCTPVSADMILTISEPSTVTMGLNDEVCSSANSYKVTGSTSTNASSILWTSSGSGTFDDDSAENPIYIFDSNESGVVTLTKTVNNLGCSSVSAEMLLTITPAPEGNVGVGGDACGLSYTLAATVSAGTGIWSQVTGPVGSSTIFSAINSGSSTATASEYGTYVYRWTISNGICTPYSADITVNFYETPSTATVGANQDICSDLFTTSLGGNTPAVGNGEWSQVTGPVGSSTIFSAINSGSSTAAASEYGTYVYRWTISNGTCTPSSADVTVNFYETPSTATVGANQDICSDLFTASLGGNTPAVGNGKWSQVTGPVGSSTTFSAINSGSSTAAVSEYGTYVYRWTISNGTCTASSADITVNFYETPSTATVGANQDICSDLITASLGGNTPAVGNGTWSQVTGPVGSSTTFSAINSGSSTATASEYGTYVYRWTISNGTCTASSADITVNFYETPSIATVGANQDICSDLFTTSLGGNSPVVGNGEWSQVAGPVGSSTIFSAINSGSSTAAASEYGTYVYRWTISNGTCTPSSADVTVNFYETPSTATVGANQDICSDLFTGSLGGNTPAVGNGEWSQVAGPVGSSTIFSAINSGSSTAAANAYGTYVYRWTISNGTCTASSADISVNFYETPSIATVGANQDICSDLFTASLGGNTPAVGNGEWSQVAGPVGSSTIFSAINSGSSTAAASEYGTYVYHWTISNGICTPSSADITVNFYETPSTATVGANQDICSDLFTASLGGNTPAVGNGTWSQVAGPVGSSTTFSAINSGSSTVAASEYGTYVYRWTISNGTCTASSADITVNFYETPSIATVGANQDICSDLFTASLGGNTPAVGNGTWSQVTGPVGSSTIFSAINSGSSTAAASEYGTYVYRWTISNGICTPYSADVTVNFYETPSIATVGVNQDICSDLFTASLGGNTPAVGNGEWSQVTGPVGSSTIFSAINSGSSTAAASEYGTYVYRWTISNGTCTASSADITVNFYETPSTATVGANQDICSDLFTASLGGNTPAVGNGTWSQVTGPVGSSTTFSAINSGSSTAAASEYGTYVYRWTISNGICTPSSADITVNFYETPSIATVGANQDICSDLITASLGGNTPAVGIGTWSQVTGPVGSSTIFSAINSGSSTAAASEYGTYVYRWTISNGTCTPFSADITVNFYETPSTATVGVNQDICSDLFTASLGGNTPAVGNGEWSQVTGPVGSSTTFSAINSGSSTAAASEYGTYVYRWTISNGSCSSNSADITVTYYEEASTATVGVDQYYCDQLSSGSLEGNTL